jgi:hypothetical protein
MRRTYLALAVLCVAVLAVAGGVTAQGSAQSRVLDFVADTYEVPRSELTIDYEATSSHAALGDVTWFKVSAPTTDAVYGAVLDAQGQIWSPEEFRNLADHAYAEQFGKLDTQLYHRFEQDPNAVIPVAIWLVVDDSLFAGLSGPDYIGRGLALNGELAPAPDTLEGDRTPPEASAPTTTLDEPGYRDARQALDDAVGAVQAAVADRLAEKGIAVEAVPGTPLLTASLGVAEVLEVGLDPQVGSIYANDGQNTDMR